MLAVIAMLAGAAAGVLIALRWRPGGVVALGRGWAMVCLGIALYGLAAEVFFVFVHLRHDEGVRSAPAPLTFFFVWTLSWVAVGAWTAQRLASRGHSRP